MQVIQACSKHKPQTWQQLMVRWETPKDEDEDIAEHRKAESSRNAWISIANAAWEYMKGQRR